MSPRHTPKEDIRIKDYWKDNDRFADFVNAVYFGGVQFVKPDSLAGMDSVLDTSLGASAMQGIADVRRSAQVEENNETYGVRIILENLTFIDYELPHRAEKSMVLDRDKQRHAIRRMHVDAHDLRGDAYLSRFSPEDRFDPVLFVAFYTGEKVYDGALTLEELASGGSWAMPPLPGFRFVDAADNELPFKHKDNIDFRAMMRIRREANDKKDGAMKLGRYIDQREPHIDVIKLMSSVTDDPGLLADYIQSKKEGKAMAGIITGAYEEARDAGKAEGKAEGRAEGIIEMGRRHGIADTSIIEDLMEELKLDRSKAENILESYSDAGIAPA